MKKSIMLLGMFSLIALTSCTNNQKEPGTTPPPTAPAPTVQTPPPAATTKPSDGTTIKVDENGVSYESKNGEKKNSVNISKDSTSIEFKQPK